MGDRLAAIREGEGTLLDHCKVVFGSSMSEGTRHDPSNLPVLLTGRIQSGRHIAIPKQTPLCNLYMSMLERMCAPVEAFGDSMGALEIG